MLTVNWLAENHLRLLSIDLQKIIDKYIPEEHKDFYDLVQPAENVSSDTDDSD